MIARLGLAAAMALTLGTGTARADDVAGYLELLEERGIYAESGDGGLVAAGQEVCNRIEAGYSLLQIIRQVYQQTSLDSADSGYLVGVAVGALCPEYSYLIDGVRAEYESRVPLGAQLA